MASTRAIARALRSFTNIGMTCLEELADYSEVVSNGSNAEKPARRATPASSRAPRNPAERQATARKNATTTSNPTATAKLPPSQRMSEAQKRAILNLSRRRGMTEETLGNTIRQSFQTTLENLSSKDASSFIRTLQQSA